MMICRLGCEVLIINLRVDSGFSAIEIPARSSMGMVSSKILPFDRASVNMSLLSYRLSNFGKSLIGSL
jgi:hypothetical protein